MLDLDAFPAERQAKRDVLLAAVESVREVVEAGTDAAEQNGTLPLNVPAQAPG